jgi:uncharacterized protein YjiK
MLTTSKHKLTHIAKIPEASGICYSKSRNSLFVANDEGGIYEINKEGKLLRKRRLGKYNLEGVACDDDKSKLYFALEKSDSILIVNQKTLAIQKKIKIKRYYHGIEILRKNRHGVEGITLIDNNLYLSNQSRKKYPKADPSVVFKVGKLKKRKTAIKDIVNHGFRDISGLSYHKGYLYMVSDYDDYIIKYDVKEKKLLAVHDLPKGAWEGITFDENDTIYLADDKGKVFRYTP